jgi:outer membrane protein assembly factor BamA
MQKLRLQISVLVSLLLTFQGVAQIKYNLNILGVDKDAALLINQHNLQTEFNSKFACTNYISKLPALLQSKGFVTASVDSVAYDSLSANMLLFVGEQYTWAELDAKSIEPALLDAVGWRDNQFSKRPMNFEQVKQWEERLLDYLENNGYPFAKVFLDSLRLDSNKASGLLKVNKGPLYKIDSIRLYGNAKISSEFLQRYLSIPNGSIYNKDKLLLVNKKLRELTYLEQEQPSNINYLNTGSVLNVYLNNKKSSQVNVLVGFLPNNDQLSSKKLLVTGEANILLRNAFGGGETMGLNWQQIQVKSPRLNLLYNQPYLFNSPVGLDFTFDMFRKDSSFLNVNFQLGAQYALNSTQSGKLFVQRVQTIVSDGGINESLVIQSRSLPDIADISSINLGVEYEFNKTDYRLNPKKGTEFRISTAIGNKKLKRNSQILELKDPGDPAFNFSKLYDTVKLKTYQLRVRATAAKYLPLGKQSTIKIAANGGMFQSGNVFRNELFQIGGYKLLRGFDEESQYLSHFVIGTIEYRLLYLTGQNSYFYVLADGGWGQNNSQRLKLNYTYISAGLGLAFESKAGLFNLAWAVGKRNDTEFNLRQSKIHLGFVSFF